MANRGKKFLLGFIIVAAVVVSFVLNDSNDEGPVFAPFTTGEMGTSLFYDTLRHMGYTVVMASSPLTFYSDNRDVYVIIQPTNPIVSDEMAAEMMEWVRFGGRLIFLQNNAHPILERHLQNHHRQQVGDFVIYYDGTGQVVIGQANTLTNRNLAQNSNPGATLHQIIHDWDAERIVFPVYYHGVHPSETFFSQLPLIIRLVIIQLGVAVLALIWHHGKRFGRPIVVYEETEREENEQVRALARLYERIK